MTEIKKLQDLLSDLLLSHRINVQSKLLGNCSVISNKLNITLWHKLEFIILCNL